MADMHARTRAVDALARSVGIKEAKRANSDSSEFTASVRLSVRNFSFDSDSLEVYVPDSIAVVLSSALNMMRKSPS